MFSRVCLAVLGTLLLVVATPAFASEAEVRAAETSWAAAVLARDLPALDAALHPDLIYSHSTGLVEGKSEYAGKLRDGVARYDVIDYDRTNVTTFGDAAVAHSIVTMKGESGGNAFDVYLIMMHVWIHGADGWQLAAHQTTPLKR